MFSEEKQAMLDLADLLEENIRIQQDLIGYIETLDIMTNNCLYEESIEKTREELEQQEEKMTEVYNTILNIE